MLRDCHVMGTDVFCHHPKRDHGTSPLRALSLSPATPQAVILQNSLENAWNARYLTPMLVTITSVVDTIGVSSWEFGIV